MAGVPTSIERVLTISRNRAKSAGAYNVERLTDEGFVLCIRKDKRTLAIVGHEATQEEALAMSAAPALARALLGILKAKTPTERMDAEGKARVAMFAAGVEVKL